MKGRAIGRPDSVLKLQTPAAPRARSRRGHAWVNRLAAWTTRLALSSLAACAGSPPERPPALASPVAEPASPAATALSALETQQRGLARQAMAEGQPSKAQQAWATVLALNPADVEAQAGHRQARETAATLAKERLRQADQARSRGETETAMRLYLEALAQDPALPGPPEALRSLERERSAAQATASAARSSSAARTSAELDYADALERAGDPESAQAVLEPLARPPGADPAIKLKTCEVLLKRARASGVSRQEALDLVNRCLRVLPRHAPALLLQRQLAGRPPAGQGAREPAPTPRAP